MKHSIRKTTRALIPLAVICLVISAGFLAAYADDSGSSKVVFHVG